jgi:hypothetical protein
MLEITQRQRRAYISNLSQEEKTMAKTISTKNQKPAKNSEKLTDEKIDKIVDDQTKQTDKKTEKKSLSDNKIVKQILEDCVLFRDQNNDPFIAPNGDGTKVIRISTKAGEFRTWLVVFIRDNFHITPTGKRLDNISQMIEGLALDPAKPKLDLELRVKTADHNLYYDLGENAVKINKDGWSVVARPPIMFRRFRQQQQQVMPETGGDIKALADFVNLTDRDDILLFLVFTVSAFIPGYPRPLCLLFGSQGSGKSTPGRLLKTLVDPTAVSVTAIPTRYEDFVRIANHHALIVFDNISSIKPIISDALARVSTGDSFSKRALYTDDDDVVYQLQRPVMLNGINQVISQSDLLDRSILLEMKRIEPSKRKTERDFWREFEVQKPFILGAIFDTVSKAIKKFPDVKLDELPRMADFAKWGYAIADSIDGYTGQDFINAYNRNIDNQHDEAINSNPVGLAVFIFMTNDGVIKGLWAGTATDLMRQIEDTAVNTGYSGDPQATDELSVITNSNLWPRDPEWFVRKLNYVVPDLTARGITIEQYREKNRRMIRLTNHNYHDDTENTNVDNDNEKDAGEKPPPVVIDQAEQHRIDKDRETFERQGFEMAMQVYEQTDGNEKAKDGSYRTVYLHDSFERNKKKAYSTVEEKVSKIKR